MYDLIPPNPQLEEKQCLKNAKDIEKRINKSLQEKMKLEKFEKRIKEQKTFRELPGTRDAPMNETK